MENEALRRQLLEGDGHGASGKVTTLDFTNLREEGISLSAVWMHSRPLASEL